MKYTVSTRSKKNFKHIIRTTFCVLFLLACFYTHSQTTMNIYQSNGSVLQIPLSSIDSITYSNTQPFNMNVWGSLGSPYSILLINIDSITFSNSTLSNCGFVTDIDGNIYETVVIGSQCWMRQNLKTSRYRNGVFIGGNDSYLFTSINSRVYFWAAVNTGLLCPTGWHVPTQSDWLILKNYLGPSGGGAMKDTLGWTSPNTGATNISGFSARPSGECFNGNCFLPDTSTRGYFSKFWTSSLSPADPQAGTYAYFFSPVWNTTGYYDNGVAVATRAFCIRCIKD